MTSATRSALAIFALAAALVAVPPVRAQEVVELTGRDQPMDPDFEEVFRVGVVTGEDWEMFGTVRSVAFDAEGNLYVFDGQSSNLDPELRVLVFDRSGTFLREFGTAGEGPGEFKMPTSYAVLRDGTTIVGDMGHQAYHIFDPSGKFVRMVRGAGETTQRGQSGERGRWRLGHHLGLDGDSGRSTRAARSTWPIPTRASAPRGGMGRSTGRSCAVCSTAKRPRRRPW